MRIWGSSGRVGIIVGAVALVTACSSSREGGPLAPRTTPSTTSLVTTTSSATTGAGTQPSSTTSAPGTAGSTATSSTVAATTAAAGTRTVTIVAVAGTTGPVQEGGPPFSEADPFTEAVRLADGTCTGWDGSSGGTTEGLEVGAPVVILEVEDNEEIGRGTIERSRWEDVADGGEQWNCFFELTATVTGSPAEFRIRVGGLQPWLAGPDPGDPDTFFASVSTDAAIGLIPACPPLPPDPGETETTASTATTTTTTTTTTAPAGPAGEWRAIGRYWSQGLRSMCRAGLAVTALARPCRPPGVGSEYISEIVDSNDPTVTYEDNARVPRGTQVTAVVATGRPCE